jgi:hypothetical protein
MIGNVKKINAVDAKKRTLHDAKRSVVSVIKLMRERFAMRVKWIGAIVEISLDPVLHMVVLTLEGESRLMLPLELYLVLASRTVRVSVPGLYLPIVRAVLSLVVADLFLHTTEVELSLVLADLFLHTTEVELSLVLADLFLHTTEVELSPAPVDPFRLIKAVVLFQAVVIILALLQDPSLHISQVVLFLVVGKHLRIT